MKVESVDAIQTVHRLMAASGSDRRGVVFEWQTATRRQTLIDALEDAGLTLRPFGDTDNAVSSFRPTGTEWLLMLPGSCCVVVV